MWMRHQAISKQGYASAEEFVRMATIFLTLLYLARNKISTLSLSLSYRR